MRVKQLLPYARGFFRKSCVLFIPEFVLPMPKLCRFVHTFGMGIMDLFSERKFREIRGSVHFLRLIFEMSILFLSFSICSNVSFFFYTYLFDIPKVRDDKLCR